MSTNAQLEQHLKTLHLASFMEQYADLAQDAQQAGWSYAQFLLVLAHVPQLKRKGKNEVRSPQKQRKEWQTKPKN
ncbi:MAG: hypothetical protein GY832_30490 [Chloroflexi bacterium]|nr:hypothetical protein [Chloroflexota bacterium]